MPTNKPKKITVVLTGSGNQRHGVEVVPGVTVRDLLEQLNLAGQVSRQDNPVPFGPDDELYSRVADGEKLIVSPPIKVAWE